MLWLGKEGFSCGLFDDPALVHDGHFIAEIAHHAQVVGDKEQGEVEVGLQLAEQVEDLRLHADVECGDRLVGDDERRAQGQGAGNADALSLAAREGVRIAARISGVESHALHQLAHALVAVARRPAIRPERLGD